MGQRSQIYIRYNVNYVSGAATKNPTTHNYKGLIARYFGWNYGERMISRARHTLEWIKDNVDYADIIGTQDTPEATKN